MTEHKRMGAIVDPHEHYAWTWWTLAKKLEISIAF